MGEKEDPKGERERERKEKILSLIFVEAQEAFFSFLRPFQVLFYSRQLGLVGQRCENTRDESSLGI